MKHAPALLALLASATLASSAAAAELKDTITPGPRPYPYTILGAQPGMTPEEAKSIIEDGRDYRFQDVRERMQYSLSSGATFTYEAVTSMTTDLTPPLYKEHSPAYNDVRISLTSPVMGQRVYSIGRKLRGKPQDLPDGKMLLSQLEQKYGKPSLITTTEHETRILYVWTTAGFVPEIKGGRQFKLQRSENSYTEALYSPCGAYPETRSVEDLLKEFPHAPGLGELPRCVAVLQATANMTPSYTTVAMYLTDYGLLHQSEEETDRQVTKILETGAAGGKKLNEL